MFAQGHDGELGPHDDVVVRREPPHAGFREKPEAMLRLNGGGCGDPQEPHQVAVQCLQNSPSHPLPNATIPIWHVLRPYCQHDVIPKVSLQPSGDYCMADQRLKKAKKGKKKKGI